MKVTDYLGGNYLSAPHLRGHRLEVTIREVEATTIGGVDKLVVYFHGKQKGLVLNKSNLKTLVGIFGEETADWLGKSIELFTVKTEYQGDSVEGIRVGEVKKQPPPDSHDDEIPF